MKLAMTVVGALAAVASQAHADPAADVAVVAKKLWVAAFTYDAPGFVASFRPGGTFHANGRGNAIATNGTCLGAVPGNCGQLVEAELWGTLAGSLSARAVGDPAVVVDAPNQVAWFLESVAVTRHHDSGPVLAEPRQARVLGIVDGTAGWKLGGAAFIGVVSDADLGAHGAAWEPRAGSNPQFADRNLIKWIESGQLAAHMTTGPHALVSGTSPAELATDGPAAAKIVATWDKLHMKADPWMAVDYFGVHNDFAWVNGSVGLPSKGKMIALHVTAIMQKASDDSWTWLALAFSPTTPF